MDPELKESEVVIDQESEAEDASKSGMRQVWLLALSLSILQIGFGIVIPIFPYYIVELNATALDLGMLAASFALTRIVLAGPLGGLSDKVGRRPVMLVALLGFAGANVIYAFAPNVIVMIAARSLEGAVSAGFYPAANAYVSDVTTIENRGTAMGYLSMGSMVGFIVGPTIGGILADLMGVRMPFIIAAIATLGTVVAVYILVHETDGVVKKRETLQKEKPPVLDVLRTNTKAYTALSISMFANMFALGILEVAFTLDAVIRFGISPTEIGVFFGIMGIVTVFGNIIFGKASDRVGRKWLIVIGSLVGAVSLYIFMTATDTTGFYFGGIVLGIGLSMRGPTIQAMTADLTDESAYGSVMGLMGAVSNSAYVVGPLLAGGLYDQTGNGTTALGVAVVMSIAGAIVASIGLPRTIVRKTVARGESPEVEIDEPTSDYND
ncbi:MAG: MFS transporter [Candidatus Thorarchaeota archaeon]|jgi:DHA1 family multidrug resistance protein-like MFS transporter